MKLEQSIQGNRICLRNYKDSDLPFLTAMWFDEENGKYMSDPTAAHVDAAYQKALDALGESKFGYYLVIELARSQEPIGSFCIFPDEDRRVFDIGYCIQKAHWKEGYGSEALALALDWLKTQGAEKVTAEVAIENRASNALLRKFGFAVEKKAAFQKYNMDVRYDSYIYAKMLNGNETASARIPASKQLELYIPKLEDLWFNQKMLADPQTMFYNKDWDVSYDGYHQDTGCIDFPEEEWADWYAHWTNHEPERFYAYIRRCADGAWLGDVNFHYTPEKDWWDMGIVIFAPFRGKGYAVPALKLMLDHAFRDCGVTRIHNDFEVARNEVSAWETHRRAGFRELGVEDGFLQMMITREDYLKQMEKQL